MPLALVALAWLVACGTEPTKDTAISLDGPVMTHTQPAGPFVEGDLIPFTVTAEDPDGVAGVSLYWLPTGTTTWAWADLVERDDGSWSVEEVGVAPGLDYYFKAADGGNPSAVSYLPPESGSAPYQVPVLEDALGLPFTEDFELDGGSFLEEMGWYSYSADFPGFPWELSAECNGGICVRHAVGNGNPDNEMEDWLISPALDFTGQDTVQLAWVEGGSNLEMAEHSLWLSTSDLDPALGAYEKVADLPNASLEDGSASAVVDLSAWAGLRPVYLAWVYTGANADAWWLDEIMVEPLHADLVSSMTWEPDPVHPGETVTLHVSVQNTVDAEASGVTASLSLPEGGGVISVDTVDVGDIEAMGSADLEFIVDLDADLPDNSYLPVQVTLADATRSWTDDLVLNVGIPSTATFSWTMQADALLELRLGVGDPDAPTWEETVFSGTASAGGNTVDWDITDQHALLPPAPGALRWYVRALPHGSGQVDAFTITFDGVEYDATQFGPLADDLEVMTWLPEPPAPVLLNTVTTPSVLEPGSTGVTFQSIHLVNQGAATQGPVLITLSSADPDVTIVDGGPIQATTDAWQSGGIITLSQAFVFDVSPAHVDSTPLDLRLDLVDQADSFSLDRQVEVPWSVLKITEIGIDDGASGNDDGLLDPGETATLRVELTNVGGLDSDGIVRGTLQVLSTGIATGSVLTGEQSFGSIAVDSSRDDEFDVQVTGGAAGDVLDLQIDAYDSRATYSVTTSIYLGEPIWRNVSPVDDPIGDSNGTDFDWVNITYREMNGVMQLRCESAVPFDPSTLFIEGWGLSPGADYTYYRIVLQSGITQLQGYTDASGFRDIGKSIVSYPSATEVQLDWQIVDMGLLTDSLSMGFAAGWCGPPEYYCDQFPDGWGYPYKGLYTSSWFGMDW